MRSITLRLGALALGLAVTVTAAPPPSAGAANEPYLIGATVSESGPGSSLGRPEADSMQMAVALRDALERVTYTGVSGTYRMSRADHNGLSTFSIVVTRIENGKFTVAK